MSSRAPVISPEVAQHVLWHYGYLGGIQPGSFTTNLLNAFATADEINFDKLQQGFPTYGAAVAAASYDPDGIQHLKNIAEQVAA